MKEIKSKLAVEFEELSGSLFQVPVISVDGAAGSGKTHLAASAPGDIGLLSTHRKARFTMLKRARELKRHVIVPKEDFERTANPMWVTCALSVCELDDKGAYRPNIREPQPRCCTKHYSRWITDRAKEALFAMHAMPNVKSIVIDNCTHLYEDITYACYGRDERIHPLDRKAANREMRELLSVLATKNLVLIHESQEIWRKTGKKDASGRDISDPTGKFKPSGWKHIGYFTSIEVEMEFDPKHANGPYFLNVRQCQENAALVGRDHLLANEQITFANVAGSIWPDADVDWD
jgi:hypothetical protein